jgi:hypothetical protein
MFHRKICYTTGRHNAKESRLHSHHRENFKFPSGFKSLNLISLSLSFLLLTLWSTGHPWNALFQLSFLILTQSVGLHRRGIRPSQGRYLHKQDKCRQTPILWVGFEPRIPAFEWAKTVHAKDRALTVIGSVSSRVWIFTTLYHNSKTNWTPWPLVRKRTNTTERPPHVGEVSANLVSDIKGGT